MEKIIAYDAILAEARNKFIREFNEHASKWKIPTAILVIENLMVCIRNIEDLAPMRRDTKTKASIRE